jgi:hypothetical protein
MSCRHNHRNPAHHLIYREELKKDGGKKVRCSWCGKSILGSLHNCIECYYRPVHVSSNDHFLVFTEKLENDGNKQEVVCSVCEEPVLGAAYKCSVSECSFLNHKSCTELSCRINHPLHPDHNLPLLSIDQDPDKNTLSLQGPGRIRCDVCCRSHNSSFFYHCRLCDFKLDIKCANCLPINPNDCHQHEFFSITKWIQLNCEVCGKEIENTAHICSICKLLVHNRCAEIPRTVKIKVHNHFLNLVYSLSEIKKLDDIFCRICYEKVNKEYAAYYCWECTSYIFHTECLIRFRDMYGESLATSESVPNISIGHATHLIKALNQVEDEGPHLGEIQHFSHEQHKLILCDDEVKDNKLCKGCMEFIISVPSYGCVQCDFFLHARCTKLPTRIEQHQHHDFHPLTLLPHASTKSGVFFCRICSRHHRGFTYKCDHASCQGMSTHLDVQCGSIPETLKHEGHQHILFLALDSHRKCKACSKDKEKSIFVCTSCDFALGIRCANLPLVARHKYDTHLLKLTYRNVVKDEYYCLICEEERNPNHWFYYCEECDFSAHIECIIGNYPSIMIGNTYTSEYHQHPLTFVKKAKKYKCKGCWKLLDDVALECSQCKFNVHPPRPYFSDCLWELCERGWYM